MFGAIRERVIVRTVRERDNPCRLEAHFDLDSNRPTVTNTLYTKGTCKCATPPTPHAPLVCVCAPVGHKNRRRPLELFMGDLKIELD